MQRATQNFKWSPSWMYVSDLSNALRAGVLKDISKIVDMCVLQKMPTPKDTWDNPGIIMPTPCWPSGRMHLCLTQKDN